MLRKEFEQFMNGSHSEIELKLRNMNPTHSAYVRKLGNNLSNLANLLNVGTLVSLDTATENGEIVMKKAIVFTSNTVYRIVLSMVWPQSRKLWGGSRERSYHRQCLTTYGPDHDHKRAVKNLHNPSERAFQKGFFRV